MQHLPCSPAECIAIAEALGDTPETVISAHMLRRGLCRAYLAGTPARFRAVIVMPTEMLAGEPMAFGDDAPTVWDLLLRLDGWYCVNVSIRCADALCPLMERELGVPIRRYRDIYHTLTRPAVPVPDPAVRLLGLQDLALLQAAPPDVGGSGFGSTESLLADGVVACAIVEGRVVAIAHTTSIAPRHADIGAATLAPWRGLGFATAAASLVAARVQQGGRVPVWSTGEDNRASRRVARKIGFEAVSSRVYLIPPRDHRRLLVEAANAAYARLREDPDAQRELDAERQIFDAVLGEGLRGDLYDL